MMVAEVIEATTALLDWAGLDEIKVARSIRLEVENELMEVLRHLNVGVKHRIGLGAAYPVGTGLKFPESVTAGDVNHPVHDLQTERMIQPRGKALPSDLLQLGIEARANPDVPMERTDRHTTIVKEIHATHIHRGLPCVVVGKFNSVGDVGLARLG